MSLVRNYRVVFVLAGWLLLIAGCSPTRTADPLPPLQDAVARNDVAAVMALLEGGTSPDSGTPNALHLAVSRGSGAAAEILLLSGAFTESRNEDGLRPLDVAVRDGRNALAELLLRYGALPDPDRTHPAHPDLCSPLYIAAQRGDIALIDQLLARGADPQRTCNGPQTPADAAATPELAERLRNTQITLPPLHG